MEILKNTKGISNVEPTLIPVQSGAGVGIGTISYDSSTEDVTIQLAVGFSTINAFPFAVGDKVLIENVSVGVGKKNSFILQNKLLQNCITGYIKNIYKSKYIPPKRIPIQ